MDKMEHGRLQWPILGRVSSTRGCTSTGARAIRARRLACSLLGVIAMVSLSLDTPRSLAQIQFDPQHPQVKQMVRAAVEYLRTDFRGTFGERVLAGLAILNSYDDMGFREDAEVNAAVQLVLGKIPDYANVLRDGFERHNMTRINNEESNRHLYRMYESCVALMLLVEYDDQAYDREIRTLIDFIVRRQRPDGSWTYNFSENGDCSQSQYCSLALWLAHHKGFDIPTTHANEAVRFWIASQYADGSWPYQAILGQPQGSQHVSLVSAGAGSVYMLGDILGVNPPPKRAAVKRSGDLFADLPPFVERLTQREVDALLEEQSRSAPPPEVNVNVTGLNAAKQRANNWFAANFNPNTKHWPYYALYGFERYASFREKIDGEVTEIPDWYDQGVEFIRANQGGNGALPAGSEAAANVQTALAVLFLVRSTQRLTNLPKDAALAGGMGLGKSTRIKGGKVINEDEKKDIAELISRVKADMSPSELADIADSFRNVAVASIKDKSRSQQLILLREMVANEHWQVRIVAVRALGQVRLIDNCPALIFALTDPNPQVVQEASIALQFVSRKTGTPPVPKAEYVNGAYNIEDEKYRQGIRELYQYWADWYLELKPDAQLLPVELK